MEKDGGKSGGWEHCHHQTNLSGPDRSEKKKEVGGTDLLGRLIYLGSSQICNLCGREDAVSHGSLRFACEPGQQAETAGLISVLLTC